MALKLNSASGSIILTPEDGVGDANVTLPRAGIGSVSSLSDLGITATSAELNILDGATVTVTEVNYLDGVTSAIQTQLDAKAATASLATVATSGLYSDLTGTPTLATVATTGAYSDLTGTPTIPSAGTDFVALSGGSFSGNVAVSGEFNATSYNETFSSLSGTTPTVNCEAANVFALTTSGNTTFTFSNPPASGTAYGFTLKVTAGGTHTLTWPASVDWAGGTAPDAPASGETDVYVFFTHDGGTNWYGFQAGDALA